MLQKDSKVLLVKHFFGPDEWMLPGGGVKFGESPKQAAIRELREELSLEVTEKNVSYLHEEPKPYSISGLQFRVMTCKTVLKKKVRTKEIEPSYEIREWRWFNASSKEVKKALPKDISP